jgi:hypothetical protein
MLPGLHTLISRVQFATTRTLAIPTDLLVFSGITTPLHTLRRSIFEHCHRFIADVKDRGSAASICSHIHPTTIIKELLIHA